MSPGLPGAPASLSEMMKSTDTENQPLSSAPGDSHDMKSPIPAIQIEDSESAVPTNPESNKAAGAAGEEDISFQVSISSHYSTPFDCILLAQAQELRTDIDNIKLNICSQLRLETDQFALATPLAIKNCNTLNKATLATGLLALLSQSEKVCATINGSRLPETNHDTHGNGHIPSPNGKDSSSVLASLKAMHDTLKKHSIKDRETMDSKFKAIEGKLEGLQSSISQMNDLRCHRRKSDASTPDFLPVPPSFPFPLDTANLAQDDCDFQAEPTQCTTQYTDKFIDEALANELKECLDGYSDKFSQNNERGHGVVSFGQPYEYQGAKAEAPMSKEFPEPIGKLISLIQAKYEDAVINQCLVNRYLDKDSLLPEHSDNEKSIVHGSNIFTVSVGDTYEVKFKKLNGSNEEIVKQVHNRSIYVMSKSSQSQWSHRIDPCTHERGLRYSITFRYVSRNSENATIIQGDSNTRFLKFGSGKGTFGDKLPGRRILKYTIDQIDPKECAGYKNVIIHCGINDIKRPEADVQDCASRLISKLEKICRVCSRSTKIVVSPILPTKLEHLNQKAKLFNQLLFDYVNRVKPRIGCLDFNSFLDRETDLLANQFGSYKNTSDPIHLGSSGIFTLSRLIIEKIRRNAVDGRMWNDVVSTNFTNYPRDNFRPNHG